MNLNYFAEVIESSLSGWVAQSWQWDQFPHFGSLVMIEQQQRTVFGIVYQVQTGSMDPVRYPFAYKKTEQELLQEQPQIFEFLKTTFSCLVLGFKEKGTMYYQLAPEPSKIHAFVAGVPTMQAKEFFSREQYLHLLFEFQHQVLNLNELLLALFKQLSDLELLTHAKIEHIIEQFSLFTGNDYRRLKLFLDRVEPLINR